MNLLVDLPPGGRPVTLWTSATVGCGAAPTTWAVRRRRIACWPPCERDWKHVGWNWGLRPHHGRAASRCPLRRGERSRSPSLFEEAKAEDPRPRSAIEAAWEFANGAARTKLQRIAALDAHRAARDIADETGQHAARSAGDAAAAAYLHPLAKATQVGHILRAAASAARAAELSAGDLPDVGNALIERARRRATPVLIDVLNRYPLAPVGKSRVAQLMKTLDAALRTLR